MLFMMFACRFWNYRIYRCWLFQKVQMIWMIFQSHTLQIRSKVSNGSQLRRSEWFNRLPDSMFASFPLAANAKPPWRTSRSFLHECEPKSVVKQLTAFCVVHFHMKRAAALGSTVWPASSGAGLCQPFLCMHSLRPPQQNKAALMKEAAPLPWPPRDWTEMFWGAC